MPEQPIRYIIVSPTKGILMGDGKWTGDGEWETVPAFDLNHARAVAKRQGDGEDLELKPVRPDKPGFRCTKAALSTGGLTTAGKPSKATGASPVPDPAAPAVREVERPEKRPAKK